MVVLRFRLRFCSLFSACPHGWAQSSTHGSRQWFATGPHFVAESNYRLVPPRGGEDMLTRKRAKEIANESLRLPHFLSTSPIVRSGRGVPSTRTLVPCHVPHVGHLHFQKMEISENRKADHEERPSPSPRASPSRASSTARGTRILPAHQTHILSAPPVGPPIHFRSPPTPLPPVLTGHVSSLLPY